MSTNDEPMLDKRTWYAMHYSVVLKWADKIAGIHKNDPDYTDDLRKRFAYVQEVLMFGNAGGRSNPFVELPWPLKLTDIERAIGGTADDVPESGSPGAWRKVKAHYDATMAGRGAGRSR